MDQFGWCPVFFFVKGVNVLQIMFEQGLNKMLNNASTSMVVDPQLRFIGDIGRRHIPNAPTQAFEQRDLLKPLAKRNESRLVRE